ncbi:MAG TPA: HAD family phosphatase [Terriglobales bacterium]|nr:HAD family phosphatase [Terriglobales bacterium]
MNHRRETRGVVFDMDGVLINSHPAHRAAWKEFLRQTGNHVPDAELAFILEGRTRAEILRHFLGDLPEAELQSYGQRKDEIFRRMEPRIEPVPGVVEFLDKLRRCGIVCAVATSASEIRTTSTIERMGLGDSFAAIVTAGDVTAGKPDPMVYRLACERMMVRPQHALAFDDAFAGVRAAVAAGLRCIGVSSNGLRETLLEAGAERVIPDFTGPELDIVLR